MRDPLHFLDRASRNFHWTHFIFQKYELEIICVDATRMPPPPAGIVNLS